MGELEPVETQENPIGDNRPKLATKRLLLRPFELSDQDAVFRICSEREVARNTRTIPHPYPRAQAEHWIKQHVDLWATGKAAIFATCLKSTGQLVAAIGLEINEKDQNAELGYWVDKNCWGQGICTEAAREVVRYGFESLALNKIHAHYMASNPGSGRVMEKIGMKKEGVLNRHIRKWGEFHDIVWYGILRSDFEFDQNS